MTPEQRALLTVVVGEDVPDAPAVVAFGVRRLLRRGRSRQADGAGPSAEAGADGTADTDGFDRRVAARLAELRAGRPDAAGPADVAPAPPETRPVARGFRRKGLGTA